MTNNPKSYPDCWLWIEIVERVPIEMSCNKENIRYLRTKGKVRTHVNFNLDMAIMLIFA